MDLFECGTDFLRKSNVSKETKSLIRSKLEDMTLNLSIYRNKYPENVDRVSVGFKDCKKLQIFIVQNINMNLIPEQEKVRDY